MFSMKLLFNNYFQSITFLVTYLNGQMSRNLTFFDETDIIINKFLSHSKIIKLKQKFSFKKKSHIFQRLRKPNVCRYYFGNRRYNINRTWFVSSKLDSS